MKTKRETKTSTCDIGLLNEIIYPTGGKTMITYEHNRYNTHFSRAYSTPTKHILTQPKACGGARVKKIVDYEMLDHSRPVNTREFFYQDSLGKETGIIGSEAKYQVIEQLIFTGAQMCYYAIENSLVPGMAVCHKAIQVYTKSISGNSFGTNNLLSEYHVAYPYVKEVIKNNGSVVSEYSSWLDTADGNDVGVKVTYMSTSLGNYGIAEKYGTLFTNDKSRFRGKLLKETTYDNDGNKVQEIVNTYNSNEAGNKYFVSLRSSPRTLGYYKIYLTPCLLKKQTITDKNNLQKEISYTYNSYNFLRSETTKNSDGTEYMKRYKYISDYALASSNPGYLSILAEMQGNKHMLNYLSEEQTLAKVSNSWKLVSGRMVQYGKFNAMYKPSKEYILETNQLLDNIEESKTGSNGTLTFNSHYKEKMKYERYSSSGNPLHIKKNDNEDIVYLWSYSGLYPVAEIKNATYSQVAAQIEGGETTINSIHSAKLLNTADFRKINALRAALTLAEITTYEHFPTTGLKSITDPRGVTTHYEYDTARRLKRIYTLENEKYEGIQWFEYNYKK